MKKHSKTVVTHERLESADAKRLDPSQRERRHFEGSDDDDETENEKLMKEPTASGQYFRQIHVVDFTQIVFGRSPEISGETADVASHVTQHVDRLASVSIIVMVVVIIIVS